MPPASPVPGWSSGDVCWLIIATRSTTGTSLLRWWLVRAVSWPEGSQPRGRVTCSRRPVPSRGRPHPAAHPTGEPVREPPGGDAGHEGEQGGHEGQRVLEVGVD